jgi:CRP-like cAMP-binding protein
MVSPRGTILFRQGQQPTGVFVLRKGRVRLSRVCADGQIMSKTVRAGHILGLLATVSDQPYLKTAETLADSELVSVDRLRVMGLLSRRADFWLQAVEVIKGEMQLIRKRVMGGNNASVHDEGGQSGAG